MSRAELILVLFSNGLDFVKKNTVAKVFFKKGLKKIMRRLKVKQKVKCIRNLYTLKFLLNT